MKIKLSKSYPSRFEKPIIDTIDSQIFIQTYFSDCMECGFCKDKCCSYGVDIDKKNIERILKHSKALEKYIGISKGNWFLDEEFIFDEEFPGNLITRTNTYNNHCIFLNRDGRGCLLHKFCIEKNIDIHELKPIVSCLFPITFDDGFLHPSDEIEDGSLICKNAGISLYRGVKEELKYYFGEEFIFELDGLETRLLLIDRGN